MLSNLVEEFTNRWHRMNTYTPGSKGQRWRSWPGEDGKRAITAGNGRSCQDEACCTVIFVVYSTTRDVLSKSLGQIDCELKYGGFSGDLTAEQRQMSFDLQTISCTKSDSLNPAVVSQFPQEADSCFCARAEYHPKLCQSAKMWIPFS